MPSQIPAREVFWNIPFHLIIYPLMVAALAIFFYGLYRRMKFWKLGQSEHRSAYIGQRIKSLLIYALGHGRILKEAYPGLMHLLIFIGFAILFIGTAVVSFDYDVWGLIFGQPSFLIGEFYKIFSLILDIAGVAAIVGILIALFRRYIQRPDRLNNLLDDGVILIWLLVILVSGFLVEAARIASTNPEWEKWSVVGYALSGLCTADSQFWHRILWLGHILISFGFIAYIPHSKLVHIITSSINIYLRSFEPKGALKSIDIENSEIFGASKISDFTWKQLLDLDACTRCGRCQDLCPAYLSGKPLSPKKLILDLQANLYAQGRELLAGRQIDDAIALVGTAVTAEEIWACTTCRACMEACPVFIEHIDKVVDLRRDRTLMVSDFPSELNQTFKGMENNFNPWGIGFSKRADWAEGVALKRLDAGETADVLWFVGCAGSFDDRARKVSLAFAKILAASGLDVGILGAEEKCCGETARRLGNEYLAQTLMEMNIELFNEMGIKKIVTFCPHCYNTFKNEYPQFKGNYQVQHSTELLAELIQTGKIKLNKSIDKKITYHDSCYLGRYDGVFDAPRDILKGISEKPLCEMLRNKNRSFCCGAGGGRMWLDETIGERINNLRTEQALETGAEMIATSCPYCLTMFTDGLKDKNAADKVWAADIIELVEQAMIK
ncbi:MAG: heterodisulfide reductase-related iron-sulfur binding cluster [Candidatus Zhuqueibacterota bacterium]